MQTIHNILPAQAPDRDAFVDIKNNHSLLRYFQNLQQQFMYANNFGLALDDEDRPDSKRPQAYLRNLFVPPHLSENHYHPEQLILDENQNQNWLDVAQVLKDHSRLFILGDPGAGKSTLLSWLMLSLSYSGDNLTKMMIGERVPFLLVLRDLPLSNINNWDTLWQVFLANNEKLVAPLSTDPNIGATLFKNGQALLLIDGLDEVTQPNSRKQLGQAVLEGINRYPRCGFIITSRLLGFDQQQWFGFDKHDYIENLLKSLANLENPLNQKKINKRSFPKKQGAAKTENLDQLKSDKELKEMIIYNQSILDDLKSNALEISSLLKDNSFSQPNYKRSDLPVYYLAPFNISQTHKYINNWYQQYLSNDKALQQRIAELQKRIIQNDGLGHLARIPVLLNMICFIHSRRGRLPDGRAELYQRIAETYLTSLDRARGLKFRDREFNYDYLDLCEWLGKLALKLQDNRSENDQSLLIDQQQVKALLQEELISRGMTQQQTEEEVEFILAYIAQRSGLFIPRGKNANNQELYGFSHLSFMEFFASFSLKLEAQIDTECLTKLRFTTSIPWWHECWALFFEQLENSRLTEKYLKLIFEQDLDLNDYGRMKSALLLAKIVMDSGVRLSIHVRQLKIKELWKIYLTYEIQPISYYVEELATFCELIWSERFDSLGIFVDQVKANDVRIINLKGVAISDLSPLVALNRLKGLYLDYASINDFKPLGKLTNLIVLTLDHTTISDLSFLAGLNELVVLRFSNTAISDLSPLAGLTQLSSLSLSDTAINDFSPLAGLSLLSSLSLSNTPINDLSPLAALSQLNNLYLFNTPVNDLSPLAGLSQLNSLYLSYTSIKDLSPLTGLSQLEGLYLDKTVISDLSPLAGLSQLKILSLSNVAISDLSPLEELSQLTELNLSHTQINDLSQLVRLSQLTKLNLSFTNISDFSPLSKLSLLTELNLSNTTINDLAQLEGLNQLNILNISNTVINDLTPLTNLNSLKTLILPYEEIYGAELIENKGIQIYYDQP